MTTETRLEADSIGTMEVPAEAYYGVQALRAKQNFPYHRNKASSGIYQEPGTGKKAAAITNNNAGLLPKDKADAIVRACDEVIAGKWAEEFIVDAIQGGAGTSANMNMNEVIANRAGELLGCPKGSYKMVHPNDHVNMAQSTNDVIPTAGKLTVLDLLAPLEKALGRLERELTKKAEEFDDVITMGRTQLQDAVPIRLGQVFHGYASMVARDRKRIEKAHKEMYTVNLGGTAVGTAINVSDSYFYKIVPNLEKLTGYPLRQAEDLFDATENLDGFVAVSGVIKTCAVDLSKMCNDLRLMSSGPKTGLVRSIFRQSRMGLPSCQVR
jgi:aspA: aspartate ammonia-lyase